MSQSPTPPGTGAGWAAPPPVAQAGPAGFVYADVPNRVIAFIIDAIVLFVIYVVIGIILAAVGFSTGASLSGASVVYAIVNLVVSGAYFWYTWTRMRGTVGMRALGMQIGNAVDGKTLTSEQGLRRLLPLALPSAISSAFQAVSGIGPLLGLLSFLWYIYLLYTTAKSPTKQGFHDVFANTMVVKAARIA